MNYDELKKMGRMDLEKIKSEINDILENPIRPSLIRHVRRIQCPHHGGCKECGFYDGKNLFSRDVQCMLTSEYWRPHDLDSTSKVIVLLYEYLGVLEELCQER